MNYKITKGHRHVKVTIETERGKKVIISDMYGVYSFFQPKGNVMEAITNCDDISLTEADDRLYKIIIGEDRPWMPDWQEDYKTKLTRAEAKAIVRHMAKECREYEERYHEICPYYYFAYRKIKECRDSFFNITHTTWEPVDL